VYVLATKFHLVLSLKKFQGLHSQILTNTPGLTLNPDVQVHQTANVLLSMYSCEKIIVIIVIIIIIIIMIEICTFFVL